MGRLVWLPVISIRFFIVLAGPNDTKPWTYLQQFFQTSWELQLYIGWWHECVAASDWEEAILLLVAGR